MQQGAHKEVPFCNRERIRRFHCNWEPLRRFSERESHSVSISVHDVHMARDVMILMRANPLQGSLEGVSPENGDFLGP